MAAFRRPRRMAARWREHKRLAFENGFGWATDATDLNPGQAPDRDLIILGLSPAEADAADAMPPDIWWAEWRKGWDAGWQTRRRNAGLDR